MERMYQKLITAVADPERKELTYELDEYLSKVVQASNEIVRYIETGIKSNTFPSQLAIIGQNYQMIGVLKTRANLKILNNLLTKNEGMMNVSETDSANITSLYEEIEKFKKLGESSVLHQKKVFGKNHEIVKRAVVLNEEINSGLTEAKKIKKILLKEKFKFW